MADGSIIIKKIKKGGHEGHHGGAWKVAYADFVTAMMAFFLLMWLLNATTEQQKRGLANYFGPPGDRLGAGGSGGILGGLSIETEGNFKATKSTSPVTDTAANPRSKEQVDSDDVTGPGASEEGDLASDQGQNASRKNQGGQPHVDTQGSDETPNFAGIDTQEGQGFSKTDAGKMMDSFEEQLFGEATQNLKKALKENPDMSDMAGNILIDQTPEGLRIQLIDKNKFTMFPSGSAVMLPKTKELIKRIVTAIQKLPNRISISGHTDAKPYATQNGYTNWELSSDRANATRRELVADGLPPDRIVSVVGRADRQPLLLDKPEDEQNRRISIVMMKGPGGQKKGTPGTPQISGVSTSPKGTSTPAPASGATSAAAGHLAAPSAVPAPAPATTPSPSVPSPTAPPLPSVPGAAPPVAPPQVTQPRPLPAAPPKAPLPNGPSFVAQNATS